VHRTAISTLGEVAEHDFVSEVYHVISGSATLVTGAELVNPHTYLMIRVDPDKKTPLKNEAASKADLAKKP
jgi:hypothetical protein